MSPGAASAPRERPLPDDPHAVRARLGRGTPLESGVRSRMERGFGAGFGEVRVHADSAAARLATHLGARAFAVGSDVAFAPGEYRPGTVRGDAILAHELAHVRQQEGAAPSELSTAPDAGLEDEADRAAAGALLDGFAGPLRSRAGLRLQRCSSRKEATTHWAKAGDQELKLPQGMVEGLDKGWKESFPGGKSREQGGILVRKADGTVEWRQGKAGKTASFTPNLGDLESGDALEAVGHTHPYDASEGGYTDVPMSAGDISTMIDNMERMTVVRSGDTTFAVTRTPEFDKLVKEKGVWGVLRLKAEMDQTWQDAYDASTGTFQEKNEAGVKAVCAKYHLLYFKGKGDTLQAVP